MRYAIFTAVFVALVLTHTAQGQSHASCGTPSPKYAPVFDGQFAEQSANPYVVQIFVHILRNTDGSNAAMSDATLRTNLDRMAAFYRPHNICFTFLGRGFIDNTSWNTSYTLSDSTAMFSANPPHGNTIDIYVHRNGFNGFGGYAYDIPSFKCSVAANASFNFEHEVGHCLGLLHTFETFSGTLIECPDGSNCGSRGDMICDTPADFANSQNFGTFCSYTGSQMINCNGNDFGYNPPTNNIMSYWTSCYTQFTNGQGTRMRNTIDVNPFLQNRLTPLDRIITNVTLTGEIIEGAQNSMLIGNIASLGNVLMNGNANGIFNAGAFVQVVPGTQIAPTGMNSILLRINDLCDGLFLTGQPSNEARHKTSLPATTAVSLEAYPNPFTDNISIRVRLGNAAQAMLQLFDFSGRLVQNIDCRSLIETGSLNESLTLPGLQPGVYFLRLQYEGGLQTVKLVKVQSD
ncbi:MAG: zinc-dependent metalloprotease [Saprospiraceae bacterium]